MTERHVQASVLHGAGDLRSETRVLPPPGPDEVQVSIRATGLCGSDLHYYKHGRNGDIIMREPLILGHEAAGVVVDKGSRVSSLKVSDRVALEVGQPCNDCARCLEGRYNICKDMKFRASARSMPHVQGTLQGRINAPAKWCYALPEGVSYELGALVEPMSVAMHAVRRSQLKVGASVLVFGAGPVGMLVAGLAKLSSASPVLIADIDKGRVDFAVEHGFASKGIVLATSGSSDLIEAAKETARLIGSTTRQVRGTTEPVEEVDVTYECTGVPSCAQAGIYATRPGGKLMLVGMGNPVYTMPMSAAASREVDILGVFRYANTYRDSISILAQHNSVGPQWSRLVTHNFNGLDEAEEAFKMAAKTKDEKGNMVLKVMIVTDEEPEANGHVK